MNLLCNVKAKTVKMAGIEVSQVAFGTEHINQYATDFGGKLLRDAAIDHNVFFWDTDNEYGSQPQVACGLKLVERDKVVICSKTYANTAKEAEEDFHRILCDLKTDYLDICLLHFVSDERFAICRGALEFLQKMKKQKLIRRVGLSTHSNDVAWKASDLKEIDIICVTLNRDGSRIDGKGNAQGQIAALQKAHAKGIGTYVIKVLGRGDLLYDMKAAMHWVMENHKYIDVYNIGFSNIRELSQDVKIVNDYYEERGL
ncbi:MAG: aldo/keto reductase [Clostridia bacterium]|nr:aldo/keto reductase [Clostridia bacterium]